MKFLADECCDVGLVFSSRKYGYDVIYVLEEMAGATDDEVLRLAYDQERVLLTEDKDFGELIYRLKKPCRGIILLRLGVEQRHLKWPRLRKLLSDYEDRLLGSFVVVGAEKFRFRPLMSVATNPTRP